MLSTASNLLRTALLLAVLFLMSCHCTPAYASGTIVLPSPFDSNDLLAARFQKTNTHTADLQIEGVASGENNVGSIWDISKDKQPHSEFHGTSAYARLQTGALGRFDWGRFRFGIGTADLQSYTGNSDAAQLWIDLHSSGLSEALYSPDLTSIETTTNWYGIGYDIPFHSGKVKGSTNLLLRRVTVTDFQSGALDGTVQHSINGDEYSGMLKVFSSSTDQGSVEGLGWSLDTQSRFQIGNRWDGQISIEGLLGQISWRKLQVTAGYVHSADTFSDPEGFLHDYGGISGSEWYQGLNLRPDFRCQLDLIYKGRPNVLLGASPDVAGGTSPNLGLAWPQRKPWIPYFRYRPRHGEMEVGAVGRNWQMRLIGDDWILASPKNAEIVLSGGPFRF